MRVRVREIEREKGRYSWGGGGGKERRAKKISRQEDSLLVLCAPSGKNFITCPMPDKGHQVSPLYLAHTYKTESKYTCTVKIKLIQ